MLRGRRVVPGAREKLAVLVLDIGSTTVRACTLDRLLVTGPIHARRLTVKKTGNSEVEYDAGEILQRSLEVLEEALNEDASTISGVAITNQRATAVVWDHRSGLPIGPALSWQDLRTSGTCMLLAHAGIRLAPNESGPKWAAIIAASGRARSADLRCGTLDSWLINRLSEGMTHSIDASNAAMTGVTTPDVTLWDEEILTALGLSTAQLPQITDTSGRLATATGLSRRIPILASIGDQQSSLIGQGGSSPGSLKLTLGTGGMLDATLGSTRPTFLRRGPGGSYPVVVQRRQHTTSWGLEAVALNAGSALDWICGVLGGGASAASAQEMAAAASTNHTPTFIPALTGLGSPLWDFGARGTFLGIHPETKREEMIRSVLLGVAQRSGDLLDAVVADSDLPFDTLSIDGKLSLSNVVCQEVADAVGITVVRTPYTEATTIGSGALALLDAGEIEHLPTMSDLAASPGTVRYEPAHPRHSVEHRATRCDWSAAVERARGQIPALSLIGF